MIVLVALVLLILRLVAFVGDLWEVEGCAHLRWFLHFDCCRAYALVGCVLGQVQLLANRLLSLVFAARTLQVQLEDVFLGSLI